MNAGAVVGPNLPKTTVPPKVPRSKSSLARRDGIVITWGFAVLRVLAMALQLGTLSFDQDLLQRQLRNDLRDDWFPDPFGYNDMLDCGLACTRIAANFERNNGAYIPDERTVFNIPKTNFTIRTALEMGLPDRLLYHGIASSLAPFYDPLLPWNVFNHRFDQVHNQKRYLFRRAIPAWQDFIGSTRSALTPDLWLLSTDLSNYFENISLKVLQEILYRLIPELQATATQKGLIRAHIDLLFRCVDKWTYDKFKGLPQNRDASSLFANIYLLSVDRAMLSRGYGDTYFRYMDDIKIVCHSHYQARRALKALILSLREIGLSVNSKKTVIRQGDDEPGINDCLQEAGREVQSLDATWRTRSRDAVVRALPQLKELTLRLIREDRTSEKDFRYCIGRLEALALCEDFEIPESFFHDVTPSIIHGIANDPASSDLFCRYLSAVPISDDAFCAISDYLCDPERNLYTWQSYRLWCVLARRCHRDARLLRRATELVQADLDDASRAGGTIYLGTLGDKTAWTIIAKHFRALRTFLGQRSALIAVHQLPFSPLIETDVKPFVRDDLVGVYKELRKKGPSCFAPLERRPLDWAELPERDYE